MVQVVEIDLVEQIDCLLGDAGAHRQRGGRASNDATVCRDRGRQVGTRCQVGVEGGLEVLDVEYKVENISLARTKRGDRAGSVVGATRQ
jgi:hypothetical protein